MSERIEKAVAFAKKAHEGQLRKSGEPFVNHPLAVKKILEAWGMDEDTIIAGVLHDTVEDTSVTLDDIKNEFGESVAFEEAEMVFVCRKLYKDELTKEAFLTNEADAFYANDPYHSRFIAEITAVYVKE